MLRKKSGMRRRQFASAVLCAVMLLAVLSGCAERRELMEVRIAYRNTADRGTVFAFTERNLVVTDGERLCNLVLQLAMTEPEDETLTSVFPERTTVQSLEISDIGVITVNFSKEYGTLSGIDRTIADYCTVLTLFGLEQVDGRTITGVMILVDGQGSRHVFTPEDLVTTTDYMRLQDYTFVIYFPNRETGYLEPQHFSRTLSDAEEPAKEIVSILMQGRMKDGTINRVVSSNAEFLDLSIRNRVCYVNFNEEFLDLPLLNGEGKSLKLYAFVNSLCELSYVDRVQFLIDGEMVTSDLYEGLEGTYTADDSLVAQ